MSMDLEARLAFARETCVRAGEITLRYFNNDPETEWKSDDSPVTIADRETEQWIRARLNETFPEDGIVGEEYGTERPDAPALWTVDPIDGTRSYVCGVPLYAVLLGLLVDGKAILGVAHFPALSETLAAANGMGCDWNGARASVSSRATLDGARVLATSITSVEPALGHGVWAGIRDRAELVRTWGDAYGHALVASGRADVMFDVGTQALGRRSTGTDSA